MPAVTPGTTSKATPASRSASASSPPRPKTNGSPPLRRTTLRPARARSTIARSISLLLHRDVAGRLADVDQLGVVAGAVERARRDQPVVEDRVGGGDQLERARGHQARVAGAGADQVDDAGGARSRRPSPRPAAQDLAGARGDHPLGQRLAERDRLLGVAARRRRGRTRCRRAARRSRATAELVRRRAGRRRRPACRSWRRAR